jgi:hypothetical protein
MWGKLGEERQDVSSTLVDKGIPQAPRPAAKVSTPPVESVAARMVNAIRIVLAFSALAVVHVAFRRNRHPARVSHRVLRSSVIVYYVGSRGQAPGED